MRKNVNNKNDVLNAMTIYEYVKAVMKIPLAETNDKRYNYSKRESKPNYAVTRELGRYRQLSSAEKRIKLKIAEETALLEKLEKETASEVTSEFKLRRHGLVELCLKLADVQKKKRELEKSADEIEDKFLRSVIIHRYFQDLDKRLPRWSATAKEMGISLNGDELKEYVNTALLNMKKNTPVTACSL